MAIIYLDRPLPAGSPLPFTTGDATYPPARAIKLNSGLRLTGLLGLAGGGVCPAGAVTDAAVRSYRTISPLPVSAWEYRLCIFCGTFPRVAPGGR